SGHQDEPFRAVAELENARREPQLLGGADLERDRAEHGAWAVAVAEDVDAEPRNVRDRVTEIGVVSPLVFLPVAPGHDLGEHLKDLFGRKRRGPRKVLDDSVNPDERP